MNFLYGNVLVCVMFLYKLFVVFLLLKRILNYGLLSLLFKVFSLFIKLKDGYNVIFIVNKRRVFKISKKGYCFEYVLVILIDYFVGVYNEFKKL